MMFGARIHFLLFQNDGVVQVAIVGGGISGLTTALCAIEEGVLDKAEVTIIAEKVAVFRLADHV